MGDRIKSESPTGSPRNAQTVVSSSVKVRLQLVLLKNSATGKSPQNFGTAFPHVTLGQTVFERWSFRGRMFCRFASSLLHTDFFNTIGLLLDAARCTDVSFQVGTLS